MKRIKWMMRLLVVLFLGAVPMVSPSSAADEPAMVVGRIFYIEGELLRYVPEENDWVAVVRDAPFGTEDTLFSGNRGMAELIVPNGTWIRIGNSTQIQFITLDTDLAEMDVASGVARFYNKSSDTVIKTTSPFGYVLAYPGTVFDFYVGDDSVEVVAVKGRVSFVHSTTEAKYDVAAGSPSILADQQQVSAGDGTVNPGWHRWNTVRENFWAAKARVRGRSVEYLPPSLHDQAYALEENGSWERVPYEGTSRWFWRPRVIVGWSPFTVGRWTDWYGDQTWIPAEPFGYVTHHYGNWVYMRNYWYWAPPVMSVRVGLPLLDVGFFWYPGRVSWIHTGIYIGWVPLAPRETYYSHRHWGGPHAVVVNNVNITQININVRNYAYVNHAVVVNQNNFNSVNNYKKVQVTNVNHTTIINNYHAAPVVNNTVINNYTTNKQRYNYTTVNVNEKPHNTVINRIQQNEKIIHAEGKEKASVVQERVKSLPEGKVNREARIEAPKGTNYIVPASEVNRPKSEIKLQQREIKTTGKPGQQEKPGKPAVSKQVSPAKPAQSGQPAADPKRVTPAKPGQQEKPGQPAVSKQVSPAKPAPTGQPAARPEPVTTAKPGQQVKPGQPAVSKQVSPAKPAPTGQPAARPEPVTTAKPSQQEKPGQPAVSKQVSPAKPAPTGQPAARPEPVTTAKPGQQVKPGQPAVSKQVSPAKPAEKGVDKSKKVEEPKVVKPLEKAIEIPKEPNSYEKDLEERRGQKSQEVEEERPKY